jgi:hypothetical protein
MPCDNKIHKYCFQVSLRIWLVVHRENFAQNIRNFSKSLYNIELESPTHYIPHYSVVAKPQGTSSLCPPLIPADDETINMQSKAVEEEEFCSFG